VAIIKRKLNVVIIKPASTTKIVHGIHIPGPMASAITVDVVVVALILVDAMVKHSSNKTQN